MILLGWNNSNHITGSSNDKFTRDDYRNSQEVSTQFESFKNYANLTEHAFEIRVLKFSPDGNLLASGSSDGSIRLWDVESGKTIHLLERHHYDVISLSFTPDGSILVSGGFDMKINFWNTSSGALIDTWSMQPLVAYDLEVSPDSSRLAIGSGLWSSRTLDDENLKLFNMTDGELIHNFQGHSDTVTSISFSNDGKKLASGSWDNSVKIWNVTDGSEMFTLNGHTDFVTSVIFSPNSSILASGSFDTTIKLWQPKDGSLIKSISNDKQIWSLSFLNSDNVIAAAIGDSKYIPLPNKYWEFYGVSQDSSVKIWDLQSETIITQLKGHKHIINSVDYSPIKDVISTGSWDWTVKLWGNRPSMILNSQADYWEISTPENQGMNSTFIEAKIDSISDNLHGVVIVRNGNLIFEKYLHVSNHDYSATDKHILYSATKSFTSALIGIAIDKGYIESVEKPILEIFSDYNFENVDDRKQAMTLQDVITMRSGLQWAEGFPTDDLGVMAFDLNPLKYVLDKPMISEPGTVFNYNTGGSQILSAVIKETTGLSTTEFATEHLFKPIGIEKEDIVWMEDANGTAFGGIGLFLTPRNMAKFGQLYLNNGSWNNEQVIPADWIKLSTQNHVPSGNYGFHWWTSESLNGFYAMGYNGKLIIVIPEVKLVIAFTSSMYTSNLLVAARDIVDSILSDEFNNSESNDSNSLVKISSIIIMSTGIMVILLRKFKP